PFLDPDKMNELSMSEFFKVPKQAEMDFSLTLECWRRLYGRYGKNANKLVRSAAPEDLSFIPGTHTLCAELPFSAKYEQVKHLDDLFSGVSESVC
ncbi:MAG: hypothetical protein KJO26_00290, partial [Deltaproteobacteria bacterium]|nr:hypothetical protein [Deltaproteobacteria bacterium]